MTAASVPMEEFSTLVNPAMDASMLPSAASPNLELVPATPEENLQAWLLNSNEWKGPLSLQQYLNRETFLLTQDLTKNNQLTCWILTSSNRSRNPDGTRPILAACETLLKSGYVARDGKIEKVSTHGIGSVYTRPEYRGRGYAARMMTELGKRLETWQQPNGQRGSFSVLYSDIGQKFYSRFGWKVFPSTHVHLDPIDGEQYNTLRSHLTQLLKKGSPQIEDLTADELYAIPAIENLEETLKVESSLYPDVPHVAVQPDVRHFAWHHAREEYQNQALGAPVPKIKGAIHRGSGIAIVWCRVYASNPHEWSLHILHVVIPPALKAGPTPDDHLALAALLLRAQKEAHDWDMQAGVEVWDPSGFVITAAGKLRIEEDGGVKVIRRDREHICSLKWTGGKSGDKESGEIVWLNNEKYAWC